jgi:hypothetical protein
LEDAIPDAARPAVSKLRPRLPLIAALVIGGTIIVEGLVVTNAGSHS